MATMASPARSLLVDRYVRDQHDVTAVDHYARAYDEASTTGAAGVGRYSALIPAAPPAPGQQYAFEVDLDACSGCKSCVAACHALNGLDDEESWRDVGLLHGGSQAAPVLQHVTTACHHCLDPACMHACPVDAYEKDPRTGIVKHLDDQCFGCQYCTLACPYDAPKYSPAKGIVRKCDMCSDRLAGGEAPACVQSCPNGAIAIRTVDVEQVVEESETKLFVPGAPEPGLTQPTTSYRTARALPRNMIPADYFSVHPDHAHWPLVEMLVLTQMSVGTILVERLLGAVAPAAIIAAVRPLQSAGALAFGLLALVVSVLHLGRPHYAFRAVIGLRHSWLSREIVAFGVFAGLAVLYAGWVWLALPADAVPRRGSVTDWLGWSVAAAGIVGIICSVMVYQYTKKDFWSGPPTAFKFFMTTVVLGLAAVWLTLAIAVAVGESAAARAVVTRYGGTLCDAVIVATLAKLAFEASILRHLAARQNTSLKRSALLITGALSHVTVVRVAAGLLGGLVMPVFIVASGVLTDVRAATDDLSLVVFATLLFAACLAGELAERYLFFTAVASPKMPGGL